MPWARRSACSSCSTALSPLPTVSSVNARAFRRACGGRRRLDSSLRHRAANPPPASRAVHRERERIVRRRRAVRRSRVARERRIDDALAVDRRRDGLATRTSSNGGRDALNTIPFETRTGYETTRSDGSRETSDAIVGAMPAMASSPLTSPANFVVGSSTTATTSRATFGRAAKLRGKSGERSKTQRRPASRERKRNGPLPTGSCCTAPVACPRGGRSASRCEGRIGSSASTGGNPAAASRTG